MPIGRPSEKVPIGAVSDARAADLRSETGATKILQLYAVPTAAPVSERRLFPALNHPPVAKGVYDLGASLARMSADELAGIADDEPPEA